jgi:hypothetical protein
MRYTAFMCYIDIEETIFRSRDDTRFATIWAEELSRIKLPAGVPESLVYQPLVF